MSARAMIARLRRRAQWIGRGGGAGGGESRTLIVIGAAGIVVVVLGLLLAVAVPRAWYLWRTDSYTAELANAAGLSEGDPVLVAGVPTGKVESIDFADDRVDVGFRLDDDRPLGSRTTASVRLETVLGKRYLDVEPAGDGSVGPERTIPLARTTVPYSLDETAAAAQRTADGLDVDALENMVRTISAALPEDSDAFRRAVTGVSAAAKAMSDDGDQINRLLTATKNLADLVAGQDDAIDAISSDARTVLDALAARRHAISGLVDDLRTILSTADAVLDSVGEESGASAGAARENGDAENGDGLDQLVDNMHSVMDTLQRNGENIDRIMATLPAGLRKVVDASGNGDWVDVSAPAGPVPDTLLCVLGVMRQCR